MQMLYWLSCGINFTFLQNYKIWQLLNIGHDYPLTVACYWLKFYPIPLTPKMESKVKYLNFALTLLSIFLYCNFACRQGYNTYKTYQTWFLIEGLGPTPWVDIGGGVKLKGIRYAATWKQIFWLQTPLPLDPNPGVGVNWSKFNFFKTW